LTNNRLTSLLITWYHQNKRELPWRQTRDPYKIWLSEVILQQTRVSQGLPYYNKFVELFPDVKALANAEEADVLRAWQGLGYYSRARNLHKCAMEVANIYSGRFPQSMAELLKLPGIGNYTAAAIASISFDEPVPVVDGNVYRVLARYFGVEVDISSGKAYRHFYELAESVIDKTAPADFNQAIMEFGALCCTPKQPGCNTCILQEDCVAFSQSLQSELPLKTKKIKVRQRYLHYFLVRKGNKILMKERVENDIWKGLYELPIIETTKPTNFDDLVHPMLHHLQNQAMVFSTEDKIIRHLLSHQVLNVNFAVIDIDKSEREDLNLENYKWYSFDQVEALPKPVLISNYLDNYLNSIHLQ
jgi:A/G-specific adenine glycosylase